MGTFSGLITISNATTNRKFLLHKEEELLVFLEGFGEQSTSLANCLEVFKVLSDQI